MSYLSRRIVRPAATAFLAAACAVTLFSAPAAHAQGLFQAPSVNQATGLVPQGVAAADLARSGFQSLVVTDSQSSNIKVYLGTGPGTFAPPYTYSTCSGPTAVLAADASGDGYPDVVVACPASNTVDIFVNQGASAPGTFGSPITETITDPVAMVAGDFAGDGTMGLAVASGNGGITILLNQGGSPVVSTVPAAGTLTGIAAGDFNRNGSLDLAVTRSSSNQVQIFTNNGSGSFTAGATYAVGTNPSGIVAADFNHNGNLDLAVTNAGSNNVTLLPGNGNGTFGAGTTQSAGVDPISVVTTDVNNDGNADLVVFDAQNANSTTAGAVSILIGNGNGTLRPPLTTNYSFVPGMFATVADFNRDGKPDIAFTQKSSNLVSLLINNTLPTPYPGGRSFSPASAIAAGNGNMADSITAADFNQDGKPDAAVSYLEDNAVRVLLNTGSGSLGLSATYPVGDQPYFVTSGDLNGDGYPDLVAVNSSVNSPNGTISVLLNHGAGGNGTFAAAVSYNVGRLPYQAAIGDLNGDGYPDIAVTNYGANTVSILYGSASGTFTAGPTLPTGANPYGVIIGDFSNNGHPDIAVTCYTPEQLYVFPNNGNGTFGSPFITNTGSGPMSLVAGDFNRDGKLDIVVANATGGPAGDTDPATSGNNISFFAGNGNGTFQPGVFSPSLNFPDSIAAGDVNGDGILDIVGAAPNYNAVVVTLGKGDGTFGTTGQRGQFAAAKQPWAVALADFNGDGHLDIATANTYNQVNITIPAYQNRYMTQYPAVPGGNPSVDLLTNLSGSTVALTFNPPSPLPANNTGTTITAMVGPSLSGPTPTGSVIFEDETGAPLGAGPATLNSGGTANIATGHLGSGTHVFTTLYSGDAGFQPSTISDVGYTLTVNGTPVTLSLSASTVQYGATFTATVTAVGNVTTGSYPHGTATIYAVSSGGGTITLGTTATLQQVGGGHNSSRTITINTANANLNVGSYQLYAVYNPSNGTYPTGSSSLQPLTVTPEPTSTNLGCLVIFLGGCEATVTPANSGTVNSGTVNFTITPAGGSPTVVTANVNNDNALIFYTFPAGLSTVTAAYVPSSNYLASAATAPVTVTCLIGGFACIGGGSGSAARAPLNAFGLFNRQGFRGNTPTSNIQLNRFGTRRNVPFRFY